MSKVSFTPRKLSAKTQGESNIQREHLGKSVKNWQLMLCSHCDALGGCRGNLRNSASATLQLSLECSTPCFTEV